MCNDRISNSLLTIRVLILGIFYLFFANISEAATNPGKPLQNLAVLKDNVEQFLTKQSQDLPGEVAISVAAFDSRLSLAECATLDIFFSGNNRAWGKTSVGVRCLSPVRWTIYAQAHVSVIGEYLVTVNGLQLGQIIQVKDLMFQKGDLTVLPSGSLTQLKDAVNRIAKSPIKPGALIKADLIAFPIIVQQGQKVRIVTAGEGFMLSTEGVALNSAAVGDIVRARVASGQTVQGLARENGQVDLAFK